MYTPFRLQKIPNVPKLVPVNLWDGYLMAGIIYWDGGFGPTQNLRLLKHGATTLQRQTYAMQRKISHYQSVTSILK